MPCIPANCPCQPLGVDDRTKLNEELRRLAGILARHVENVRSDGQTVDLPVLYNEVESITFNVAAELGYVITAAMALGRAIEKREHDNRLIKIAVRGNV